MAAGGMNLTGNVTLNASEAVKAATTLGQRFEKLAGSSRTSSATIKQTAAAMKDAAAAAALERKSLSDLAMAQTKVNAANRESLAKRDKINSAASDASGIAATKKQIMLGESMAKITDQQVLNQERLNNEQLRGVAIAEKADQVRAAAQARLNNEMLRGEEIQARTTNAANVANGRVALTEARAQTEAVRQRVALEQSESRVLLNNARIAEAGSRSKIAAARLAMQQEEAASAAAARGANQARESLAVTRGALGAVGGSLTHFGTVGAAVFIGMAANAIIMDREFANVVRTSDLIDSGLSKVAENKGIASLKLQFDALAQTLPISYKQLTEIGAAANQLGVSHENLASFTKTVAMFSATTGVTVDAASTAFGRLDSLIVNSGGKINGVNHDYQALADSINKVGVKSVATDQQIIAVSSQIAGVANAAGLGMKDIVGFSGALASVSVSPYLARGMTTRLFQNITNAVQDGGTELAKFATTAGMSAQAFSDAWQKDPSEALTNLFDGIRQAGPNAVNVLKSLGVQSVLDQPALIRLANAADSVGNSADMASRSGGILRQTFHDAASAAGENAKQYAVISNTVSAKLQVALNRVQILFRNLGEANLGPLGAMLDGISNSALKLSQNLDKPFKLLGNIKLPWGATNGEVLGFVVALSGVLSVLALVGGGLAKLGSGLIAVRQAFVGIRTFMNKGTFSSFSASANEATGATNRLAASTERLAAARGGVAATAASMKQMATASLTGAEALALANSKITTSRGLKMTPSFNVPKVTEYIGAVNKADSATRRITVSTSMFSLAANSAFTHNGSRFYQAYASGVDRMLNSNNKFINGLGVMGTKGTVALARLENGIKKVPAAFGRAAMGVGNFLSGPMGMLTVAAIAVPALLEMRNSIRAVGTNAGDASVQIAQAANSAQMLAGIRINTKDGILTAFSGPKMESFVSGTAQFKKGLQQIGSGGFLSDFGKNFSDYINGGSTNGVQFDQFTNGLDKLDAGFKQLVDGGNMDGAVKGIQTLFKGMSDQEIQNALGHMGNATSILNQQLNLAGKTAGKNDANIIKLAHSNDVLGKSANGAADGAGHLRNALTDNTAAVVTYMNSIKGVGDGTVDLNKQFEAVASNSKSKNPFNDFVKGTKQSFQDYVDFQKNVLKVSYDTNASMSELGKLDPGILDGAVKGGKKGEQQLVELMQLKDARAALDNTMGTLGADPGLLKAFETLGPKIQSTIAKSLGEGASIPDAFAAAGPKAIAAFNNAIKGTDVPPIDLSVKVDEKNLSASLDNLNSMQAKKLSIQIMGDAAPAIKAGASAKEIIDKLRAQIKIDADTVIAQQKGEGAAAQISRLKATLNVLGDNTNVISSGMSAAEQIGALQARIIIDADPSRAKQSADDVKGQISTLIATMFIHGISIPARKEGESAAEYVNRLHATLAIGADAAIAKLKGLDAATQISSLKALIHILGEDAPARAKGESTAEYIKQLRAFLRIEADPSKAQADAAALQHRISSLKATLKLHGDTAPGKTDAMSLKDYADLLEARVKLDADPGPAKGKLDALGREIDDKRGMLLLDADPSQAASSIGDLVRLANGSVGQMLLEANPSPANATLGGLISRTNSSTGSITIGGLNGPAMHSIELAVSKANSSGGSITVGGHNSPAMGSIQAAVFRANRSKGSITVGAHTGEAEAAINTLTRPRSATISVSYRTTNSPPKGTVSIGAANGGPIRGAGTATSDSIPAMLSNGEYVIRASRAKQFRNLLDNINYHGVAKYASGGHVTQGSAKYQGAAATFQSSAVRQAQSVSNITELSPYDRHILQQIADNIGISIAPDYLAGATTGVLRNQGRRGNG